MSVNLTIDGIALSTQPGTTLRDAVEAARPGHKALAARIGGEEFNLGYAPKRDCAVQTLTLDSSAGRRVYERSLVFLMLMAARAVFPGKRFVVETSLGRGLLVRPYIDRPFNMRDMRAIEEEMRAIVQQDLPLKRERQPIEKAVQYFTDDGQMDKVRLLAYRRYNYFDVYRCGDMVEYLYGEMVPSTGYLDVFALHLRLPGMMLMMPDPSDPSKPARFVDLPKLARALDQSERWGEILHCGVAADLNDMIEQGKLREFIRVNEALHEKSISAIADAAIERGARAIMIAGPSSSGKTTFTNRLAIQLRVQGLRPMLISLDNYYLDKEDIPMDENGERDYEAIDTLDIPRFNRDLELLLSGEEVEIPIYSFKTGTRQPKGVVVQLGENQPVLIEGIHGLNERMSESIPASMKYKVYISALMQLNLDDHNRIRSTEARLLRRLVRDYHHRNTSMEETLGMWPSVRRGEEKWIFPYQEEADIIFNSSLSYELVVIRKHIHPLLSAVPHDSDMYAESRRLVKFLNYFLDADVEDEIPPTSILREFIGGCTFYKD